MPANEIIPWVLFGISVLGAILFFAGKTLQRRDSSWAVKKNGIGQTRGSHASEALVRWGKVLWWTPIGIAVAGAVLVFV